MHCARPWVSGCPWLRVQENMLTHESTWTHTFSQWLFVRLVLGFYSHLFLARNPLRNAFMSEQRICSVGICYTISLVWFHNNNNDILYWSPLQNCTETCIYFVLTPRTSVTFPSKFKPKYNLSLTLTKVLFLPNLNLKRESGQNSGLQSVSPAHYTPSIHPYHHHFLFINVTSHSFQNALYHNIMIMFTTN